MSLEYSLLIPDYLINMANAADDVNLLISSVLDPNGEISKHSRLQIIGLTGAEANGFVAVSMANLQFNVGNTWDSISGLTGGGGNVFTAGAQVAQMTFGRLTGQNTKEMFVPIAAEQYTALWMGPQIPEFAVDVLVVNYKGNDIRKDILSLYSSVMSASMKVGMAGVLRVPLDYNPMSGKGTMTVNLGTWFSAPGLIVTNVHSSYSKEVVGDGEGGSSPLYATATIGFKPYKAITYNEFRGYFKQGKV
jgi:hypothetical protein